MFAKIDMVKYQERKGGMAMKGELNRTIMIYVDSYDNHVPVGHFHVASNPETTPFNSLSRLLIDINDYLDKEKFPQSFTELRKFRVPAKVTESAAGAFGIKKGGKATFAIRLLFRQNASWQGSVSWLEGQREEAFRSVLELLFLIDSAISEET